MVIGGNLLRNAYDMYGTNKAKAWKSAIARLVLLILIINKKSYHTLSLFFIRFFQL